ncbi:MAG: PRC-barrel domain-containing protein, partial [Zavarzinia sp.]|nr:PRC-barrel domain-containing protein [Zavarzinia sp.]
MNKTLPAVALAAILAGSLTPALAAEPLPPAAPTAEAPLPPTTPSMADPIGSGAALTAGALIGTDVTNPAGETVGEVTDLVIGENNTIAAAIISVGGFLGVGD